MRVPIAEPPDNPPCFACGSKNPEGMKLQFFLEGDAVVTEFSAPRTWSGWGRILHGGFQSLLLDEVCSWAYATLSGSRTFVTAELNVEFKRPVLVEQPLTIRATLVEQNDKLARAHGEILDESGSLLTEGHAVIRVLSPDRFESLVGDPVLPGLRQPAR